MKIELSSVHPNSEYNEKPQPTLEVVAENPGTVVLKIAYKGVASEYVEVGTLALIHALLAIGHHDLHENVAHDAAYRAMQGRAVQEYYKNHPEPQ